MKNAIKDLPEDKSGPGGQNMSGIFAVPASFLSGQGHLDLGTIMIILLASAFLLIFISMFLRSPPQLQPALAGNSAFRGTPRADILSNLFMMQGNASANPGSAGRNYIGELNELLQKLGGSDLEFPSLQ
jgi:hypothetical protein